MSSSEDVFTGHDTSSYSQQNGDVLSSPKNIPGRATMESIKSVHENPFYKSFGIRHNAPPKPRHVSRSEAHEEARRINSNGRSSSVDDDDDIGEYRPGSGYVHKLLDKFSSLTAREEITITHLKRSSSLDELQVENEAITVKAIAPRASGISATFEKPSYLSTAKLSHRARSIESLNHSHHKLSQQNLALSLRHVETKWDKERQQVSPKFKRDSHFATPDLELARDDIVIIENTTFSPSVTDTDENEGNDEMPKAVNIREVVPPDEMPKPNTVLTVRSIFESASSGSGLYTRRHKSDSPLSPSSLTIRQTQALPSFAFGQDGVSNRVGVRSPSPITSPRLTNDPHVKPILLPVSSTILKSDYIRHKSDSSSYSNSDSVRSSVSGSRGTQSPPSHVSSHQKDHQPEEDYISSATFNSSSTINKSGEPLSASVASSFQKSSSVTSSEQTKDQPENRKIEELPVMIFSKSKLSPGKEKPQRIADYTQQMDVSKEAEDMNKGKDIISPKEAKKIFEADDGARFNTGTDNNILSHRFHDSDSRIAEKTVSEQNKKIVGASRSVARTGQLSQGERSNSGENELELKFAKPAASRRTNVAKPRPLVHEQPTEIETLTEPQGVSHSLSSKGRAEEVLDNNSPNGITISVNSEAHKDKTSKRSYPNDVPALNEQPLSKVSKDKQHSSEQPVKGIPSIVAQRLRKQKSDPSQVADDVVSSSEELINEDPSDGNIFSRKHLTPVNTINSSSGNDSLSLEIENEIASVRKKMEGNRSKSSGPAKIFDSSQLSKKRREKKQQGSVSNVPVPPLDLSGINNDKTKETQPQQKSIAPCNIEFIGANAETSRSLLIKQRKVKVNCDYMSWSRSNDIA